MFFVPHFLFAAQIDFSVVPNTSPNDSAVIIEARLSEVDEPLNAIEGRIGFLGEGSSYITDIVVETGDSLFTLWPVDPVYSDEEHIIRFVGGTTGSISDGGLIFRMRLFTKEQESITVSWLGGLVYRSDGVGTPEGVSSRSLVIAPEDGEPNLIRSTSEDSKPPHIESIEVSSDPTLFEGAHFISVYATDDMSGISHYEVTEEGVTTRVDSGQPYRILNQDMKDAILVTVYDKAGNSVSIKLFEPQIPILVFVLLAIAVLCGFLLLKHMPTRPSSIRGGRR